MSDFYNPYNFIPAPPPNTEGPLGHHAPAGHHKWHADRWSGRIKITIEAVSPLLIPDSENVEVHRTDKGDHRIYRTRMDGNRPLLPVTSLKGMLRSAYEAVTNSRLGVVEKHDAPLGLRMNPKLGLQMVPARVEKVGAELKLRLLFGSHDTSDPQNRPWPQPDGRGGFAPPQNMTYAAWLPRYGRVNGLSWQKSPVPKRDGEHWFLLGEMRHTSKNFRFWEVLDHNKDRSKLNTSRKAAPSSTKSGNYQPTGSPNIVAIGYFHETNQNIGNKHDERVFFSLDKSEPVYEPLKSEWTERWKHLIADYRKQAEKAKKAKTSRQRQFHDFEKPEIGKTALSRQTYDDGFKSLQEGSLCYALWDPARKEISGLYPVMISRDLHKVHPAGLLPKELHPAADRNVLSPADRVFGWVHENHDSAKQGVHQHRGQLRISHTSFDDDCLANLKDGSPLDIFEGEGLPLSILGQPKPQQSRFYVARDTTGTPQMNDLKKVDAGYADGKGLRGRKVYPHLADIKADSEYWRIGAVKADAKLQNGEMHTLSKCGAQKYREFIRRPDNGVQRDDQNRSIRDWIKPGCKFTSVIDVINLSKEELGALLFLLDLGSEHVLKIGGGKPLGFGSVKLSITSLDVRTGQDKAASLRSMTGNAPSMTEANADTFIDAFKSEIARLYKKPAFDAVPFIKEFLAVARGYSGKPVHYPRVSEKADPAGENFKWFVANEGETGGARMTLPALADQRGLKLEPVKAGPPGGGGSPQHQQNRQTSGRR